MAANVELIHCGGGNRRFYEIAKTHGFLYGAQLPDTIYGPLHFADQDWKKPNRQKYMSELAKHRPFIASVLDWEQHDQLPEVLSWAEEAAQYVQVVMIIPKVTWGVDRVPLVIGGRPVRLGYSVPTKFGGTSTPIWEFGNRPVHLLGGNPHRQLALTHYLNVVSADSNFAQRMAVKHCAFYEPDKKRHTKTYYWPTIQEAEGQKPDDAPYKAFARSCENIMRLWRR